VQEYRYDNLNHAAPPVLLRWLNRKGDAVEKWIFVRCCGMIGVEVEQPGGATYIRTYGSCDECLVEEEAPPHEGWVTPLLPHRHVTNGRS
jgi:hypothetical protein